MATAPARQRQGAGRALLQAVLRELGGDGNTRFYLIATAPGKPLSDAMGFTTIDDLTIYIAGQSQQFASP